MERLDFCIQNEEIPPPTIIADAIYSVFAKEDYEISHLAIPNSYVFIATLSGQGCLTLANKTFHLHSGDIFLFDASQAPFDYQCTDINWSFWWFEFRCLNGTHLDLPMEKVIHHPLNDVQLYLCTEALNRLKLKDGKTSSSLLTSLLCLMCNNSTQTVGHIDGVALFQKADAYIRQNLAAATVESTATFLKISERTLLGLFRSLLDVSTVEYIQNLKTDMARHLLLTNNTSIRKIAETLGYADQFTFCKSFRKRFGLSPTQYKKQFETEPQTKK